MSNIEGKSYSIVTIILRIIGIVTTAALSFYFGSKENKAIEPTFIADNRVKILSSDFVKSPMIKILRSVDNRQITGDVYSQKFYFFNQGSGVIRYEDILSPLTLTLSDTAAEIVDLKMIKTSRDFLGISLAFNSEQKNSLGINFKLLEENDGVVGQIIYTSKEAPTLQLRGAIEGAPNGFSSEYNSNIGSITSLLSLWPAILLIVLILGGYFMIRGDQGSDKRPKSFIDNLRTRYRLIILNPANKSEQTSVDFIYGDIIKWSMILFAFVFIISLFLANTLLEKWFDPTYQKKIELPSTLNYDEERFN